MTPKLNVTNLLYYRKRWVSKSTGDGFRGSIPERGSNFVMLTCSDQLWGPPSLLSTGYQGLFCTLRIDVS